MRNEELIWAAVEFGVEEHDKEPCDFVGRKVGKKV
jgi:hypothetical protein